MTESKICTCPSGDGSLRWPCPAHPAVEQAGGDERAAFEQWLEQHMSHHFSPEFDLAKYEDSGEYRYNPAADYWKAWQARAALAQPSPKSGDYSDQSWINAGCPPEQPEQAEAERPEVVARVVHSNPVVLGQCGPLNANDELMTVAQHAASVARWAEMFNRVEQERDAALARVAELTATRNRYGVDAHYFNKNLQRILRDFESFTTDELARSLIILAKVADEKVVAQAQHSVPEEFSFEYRHPNGESHTVTVSRDQVINEMPDFLFEALCSKFCNCEPAGETNVVECCCDEYAEEFKLLAAAPGNSAQHSVPIAPELKRALGLVVAALEADGDRPTSKYALSELKKVLAAAHVCHLSRNALTEAQMRRLYENSTETENERLGFEAFARLIRRAEAVHQITAAPGKEVGHE
ncbi:hypothetical protein ACXR8V_09555 [Pseudomonas aeruginosa]